MALSHADICALFSACFDIFQPLWLAFCPQPSILAGPQRADSARWQRLRECSRKGRR